MQYSIVYSSQTGNTAALAEQLRAALPEQDCVYCGAPSERALAAPLLFIGFWTDKGVGDEETQAFLKLLSGKRVALFGTAGFGEEQSYFDAILARTESVIPVGNRRLPGFMCPGKMPQAVCERYQAALAKDPNMQRMIDNFDRVQSRPDEADFARLKAWALALLSAAEQENSGALPL